MVLKNSMFLIFFMFFFSLPCFSTEKNLPDGYDKVKLFDTFEQVNAVYNNLLKINLPGPFKSNLYVLQLDDPYIKEVDFEFSEGRLIWICIRYKTTTGQWNSPQIVGFGDYPFETMEEKFVSQYGEPDNTDDGEKRRADTITDIWKIWVWRNEKVVMEFEGKCHFSMGQQGAYVYTQNIYPKELEEKIKEIREK